MAGFLKGAADLSTMMRSQVWALGSCPACWKWRRRSSSSRATRCETSACAPGPSPPHRPPACSPGTGCWGTPAAARAAQLSSIVRRMAPCWQARALSRCRLSLTRAVHAGRLAIHTGEHPEGEVLLSSDAEHTPCGSPAQLETAPLLSPLGRQRRPPGGSRQWPQPACMRLSRCCSPRIAP